MMLNGWKNRKDYKKTKVLMDVLSDLRHLFMRELVADKVLMEIETWTSTI